jgi:hypothetical protein
MMNNSLHSTFLLLLFILCLSSPSRLFSQPTFTKNALTTINDRAEDLQIADFNGDGLPDILAGIYASGSLNIWFNSISGSFNVQTIATGFTSCQAVGAGDLDNDGDVDVVAATEVPGPSDKLAWFRNNGSGIFTQFDFALTNDSYYCIHVVDLDKDGSTDFLTTGLNGAISLFKNNGNATFTKSTVAGSFGDTRYVRTADLDGDGILEVLAASGTGNELAYWKKNDLGAWIKNSLITGFNVASSVHTADLDADGDVDILGTAFLSDEVAWWQNTGGGVFSTKKSIGTGFDGAGDVKTADLDKDGDLDIIAIAYSGFDLAWWRQDGNLQFTKIPIDENTRNPRRLRVADLNLDGDIDLVTAGTSSATNGVVIWRNNLCSAAVTINLTETLCTGESVVVGTDTITVPGSYTFKLQTASGCDSIVTLNLSISIPDTTIFKINQTLVASDVNHSVQWIDCVTQLPLPGEISNVFNPIKSGSYAAVITDFYNCSATSSCYDVVVCPPNLGSTSSIVRCPGEVINFGGQTITTAGIYEVVFKTAENCDSTVVLTVIDASIAVSISKSGNKLQATASGAAGYQWIDCTTQLPIQGATMSSFTPTSSGTYAVIATDANGCTAQSTCLTFIFVGTDNLEEQKIRIMPNPATSQWVQVAGLEAGVPFKIECKNLSGIPVTASHISGDAIFIEDLPAGVYLVSVLQNGKLTLRKLSVL